MKIALLYDYMVQIGGGERVLETLCEIFPQAPIYTILYDEEKTGARFRKKEIHASFLNFPIAQRNHFWFIPFMPLAAYSINLKNEYDLIISITTGYAKGIRHSAATKHLSYCLSPLRYAWEPRYIPGPWLKKVIANPILSYLRSWDYKTAQRADILLADSKFIADKIQNYYQRESMVLHPPIDETKFFFDDKNDKIKKSDYFVAAGRLMHYKKFDLAINVFNRLDIALKIAGTGPEYGRLRKMIKSDKIEMLGFVSDEELQKLYAGARALVFPQIEDFGLVPVEAQACGTPVIAYAAGGALETVKDGKTGIFFKEQSAEGLKNAILRFMEMEKGFSPKIISNSVKKFSRENFKNEIMRHVKSLISSAKKPV